MRWSRLLPVLSLAAPVVLAACQPEPAAAPTLDLAELGGQDAELAQALWERIAVDDDFKAWVPMHGEDIWLENPNFPGFLFSDYANDTLWQAGQDWAGQAPADSILVKYTYNPDRALYGLHVMWKQPGLSDAWGDWYWLHARYDDETETRAHAVAHDPALECVACHATAEGNDYILSYTF